MKQVEVYWRSFLFFFLCRHLTIFVAFSYALKYNQHAMSTKPYMIGIRIHFLVVC